MIIDILPKKEFFRNKTGRQIFIFCFPMLYEYEALILRNLKRYWPELSVLAKNKKLLNGKCKKFTSKYGHLYLVSLKLAEPGNYEQISKRIAVLKDLLEKMDFKRTARVEFSSFVGGESDKNMDRKLKIFAESDKKFIIYR